MLRRVMAIAVLSCALAAESRATVLVGADLGELSRDAQAIVRGRVLAVDARWTDDHRGIETVVTLAVDATLKGGDASTVRFVVPGGQLGRYRSIFVGAPEFSVAQPVIVFLGAHGPSVPYLVGFSQGVYRLIATADGPVVIPPAMLPVVAATRIVRGDAARRPMPLALFEQRVRALAGGAQ